MKDDNQINLPKNYKKLKWTIGSLSITSFFFVAFMTIFGFVWIAITSMSLTTRLSLAAIFWLIGSFELIKIEDRSFWQHIFIIASYLFSKKKYTTKNSDIQSIDTNPFLVKSENSTFACWSLSSSSTDIDDPISIRFEKEKFECFIKEIGSDYVMIFYKTKNNLDLKAPIQNLEFLIKKSANTNESIIKNLDVEMQVLSDLDIDANFKYDKLYLFTALGKASNSTLDIRRKQIGTIVNKYFIGQEISFEIMKQLINKTGIGEDSSVQRNKVVHNNNSKDKLLSIRSLPIKTKYGWGKEILEYFDEAIITVIPISRYEAVKQIENAKQKSNLLYEQTKKQITKEEADDYYSSIQESLMSIKNGDDSLKDINFLLKQNLTTTSDVAKANGNIRELESIFGFKLCNLNYKQEQAYADFFIPNEKKIYKNMGIPLTSEQLGSASFIPKIGLVDKNGIYLGHSTNTGLPIIFDPFFRDDERKNSNTFILGTTGSGKSVLLKKLVKQQAIIGNSIYLLDIEREYSELFKKLGGEILEIGKGENAINPLEIFNKTAEGYNKQLAFLETMLMSLFNIDSYYINKLVSLIRETYTKFKITQSCNLEGINYWPIFSDVYEHAMNRLSLDKEIHYKDKNIILYSLEKIAKGVYSPLLNNRTKIRLSNKLVSFDLNYLSTMGAKVLNDIAMFLILNIIEQKIIENRNKDFKTNVVVDEAWKMVDAKNPIALEFLFQQSKRIRKYNGAIILATQNIKDFTGSKEASKYTEGIISNMQYRFYGNLKIEDLNALISLSNSANSPMSEYTIDLIKNANRGSFYFQLSERSKYNIQVDYYSFEKELFE